ncbi:MAG: hypothetical protein MJH10_12265 [Epibacterium sp.]|nr:hypothetical protein [Epibacterium sp.]NQX74323.1 hypothetical protein [Epibacterium sp.]
MKPYTVQKSVKGTYHVRFNGRSQVGYTHKIDAKRHARQMNAAYMEGVKSTSSDVSVAARHENWSDEELATWLLRLRDLLVWEELSDICPETGRFDIMQAAAHRIRLLSSSESQATL